MKRRRHPSKLKISSQPLLPFKKQFKSPRRKRPKRGPKSKKISKNLSKRSGKKLEHTKNNLKKLKRKQLKFRLRLRRAEPSCSRYSWRLKRSHWKSSRRSREIDRDCWKGYRSSRNRLKRFLRLVHSTPISKRKTSITNCRFIWRLLNSLSTLAPSKTQPALSTNAKRNCLRQCPSLMRLRPENKLTWGRLSNMTRHS